eukprot:TRINITY_DN3230_c0_g1_i4.p1 TRINITY_DN3230_c0_g1~~TRINITY_DN3230_c0_g1_i4.p1  ORF type:complete len:281 (+),score=48.84 TRINITY_DN3230_c0_g1_i4:436-1278(+)
MQLFFFVIALCFGRGNSEILSCDCTDNTHVVISWDLRGSLWLHRYWVSLSTTMPMDKFPSCHVPGCRSRNTIQGCPSHTSIINTSRGDRVWYGDPVRYCALWTAANGDCNANTSLLILQQECVTSSTSSGSETNYFGFFGLLGAVVLLLLIYVLVRRRYARQVVDGEEMWRMSGEETARFNTTTATNTNTTTIPPTVTTTTTSTHGSVPPGIPPYSPVPYTSTNPYVVVNNPGIVGSSVQLFPVHPLMQTNDAATNTNGPTNLFASPFVPGNPNIYYSNK